MHRGNQNFKCRSLKNISKFYHTFEKTCQNEIEPIKVGQNFERPNRTIKFKTASFSHSMIKFKFFFGSDIDVKMNFCLGAIFLWQF